MVICLKRDIPLAFHLCRFYFNAVLTVSVPFRLVFRAGCGIRLYQFLIIAFLSTLILALRTLCVTLWFQGLLSDVSGAVARSDTRPATFFVEFGHEIFLRAFSSFR